MSKNENEIFEKPLSEHRKKHALVFPAGEGQTKQSFKDECDVNKIVPKALKNGTFDLLLADKGASYGDFSEVPEYHAAMNIVAKAHEQFDALSAETRERFSNDPAKFLEFTSDPQNGAEMVKLGLAVLRTPVPPQNRSGDPVEPLKKPKGGKAPVGDPPSGEGPDA